LFDIKKTNVNKRCNLIAYTLNFAAPPSKDFAGCQFRYIDGSRSPSFYTASPAESDIETMTGDNGKFNDCPNLPQRTDPTVKNRLFQAYCSSHYGSELWNLDCDKITEYCTTWRKGLRRIWELPYKFRSDYLSAISGTRPIYDELCRRSLNYITT